jgi:hypothetical protein
MSKKKHITECCYIAICTSVLSGAVGHSLVRQGPKGCERRDCDSRGTERTNVAAWARMRASVYVYILQVAQSDFDAILIHLSTGAPSISLYTLFIWREHT